MNSILITGCNRGLGLGLVKSLVQLPKPPRHIFTTCRNLEKATELREINAAHKNVYIFEIDLRHFDALDGVISQIDQITQNEGLNVLFNNAGIATKSVRLKFTKAQDLTESFLVNTVAPIMMTKSCLPLLEKASQFNSNSPMGVGRAAIINMSSILGSIAKNDDGGMYAYRTSKVAINMATKTMSADLRQNNILCVCLHPGWVRTDMGGSNAPLDIPTACNKIIETVMNFNESHNGGYFEYTGKPLPW